MPTAGTSAKSDKRRRDVVSAAVTCFAHRGFYGTTTHEIAEAVGISQPYLYRLFPNKEALFAAAVEQVSVQMTEALTDAVDDMTSDGDRFEAARIGYRALVEDGIVLRFLMHANCAATEPLVEAAVKRCYSKQVEMVRRLLGDDQAVREWFGAGLLDNVVTVLGLVEVDEPWAHVLVGR